MGEIIRIRRLRWWQRLFDRRVRQAMKTAAAARELQVVDYTDDGMAVTMPAELADTWDRLPLEVRTRFMADMDAQKRAGLEPGGTNEWRP